MRKTVSISISGMLFHVEEQAYKKLEQYLASIRSHFATYEDEGEIVSDIENRIAEHFTEKLSKSKKVIGEADVDDLIAHMGTVKDFAAFEGESGGGHEQASSGESFTGAKRLYRDPDNQMIAGVAAGIANYFGVDPTIVRLLFLLTLIPGGSGIVIYIILWIVMPEAKTTSEKVEMRGYQLTLKRIEAAVREKIPAATESIKPGTFTRIVQFPFMIIRQVLRFIVRIVRFIVPITVRLIGVFVLIAAIAGMFFLTFTFIMLLINAWEAYMDVPVRQLAGNTVYYTALVSGYLVAFLPGVLIILLGTSMMIMRNVFHFPAVIAITGVWVAALLVGSVTVARDMPALHDSINQYIETHETEASKSIPLSNFSSIEARGNYNVQITRGTGTTMRVSGTSTAVQQIEATVKDGVLTIAREHRSRFCVICLGNTARVDITVPGALSNISAYAGTSIDVDGVDITGNNIISSGGTRVVIRNARMPNSLNMEAMGGARIDIISPNIIDTLMMKGMGGSRLIFAGQVTTIDINQHAGTTVELSGTGSNLKAQITSGSRLNAQKFSVANADIDVSAGGSAEVRVSDSLTGSAHGGGAIWYEGEPETIDVNTDPSGSVERMNNDNPYEDYESNAY